jgi:LuxR family transcriptional regulator, maltose regulon positive regulatory protein
MRLLGERATLEPEGFRFGAAHTAWEEGDRAQPMAASDRVLHRGGERRSVGESLASRDSRNTPLDPPVARPRSKPIGQADGSPESQLDQPPLLATKTFIRRAQEGLVPRPHLIGRLDDALKRTLTLISAPAGFGKTTLLAEWLRNRPHNACWLSLDAADNDLSRFLSYIIATLQQVIPGVGRDLVLPLRSPQPLSTEAAVATLVNELASVHDHIVLVLDDYHVIASTAVNRALTFFLENLPPTVHLVVSTRSDPPIPIARLRARGQVAELRTDDLRFTPDEAAAFLSRGMGLALSPEQVAALDERTEGWIAGLQMAALSMRGRDDVDGFIRAFAGTNRFILDFLVEEVLSREPEAVQTFLLQTSVLTRLAGPLCDAVTGAAGGQEMLERLERANLFLVPLDDDRLWYRYHHLFADLLRSRLLRSGADSVRNLHRRAAEWLDREGFAGEAVSHSIAAEDYNLAAQLVGRHWFPVAAAGQTSRVHRWLAVLPEEAVRAHPWLSFASAWLCYLQGRHDEVEAHLDDATRALAQSESGDSATGGSISRAGLLGNIPALRSHLAVHRGDIGRALALARESLDLTPKGAILGQAHAISAMAFALEGQPDSTGAVAALQRAIPLFREARNSLGVAIHTYNLTRLLIRRGELARAEAACREALRLAESGGLHMLPAFGIVHTALAGVFLARAEVDAADRELRRGLELGRDGGSFEDLRARQIALARLQLGRGDPRTSLEALREAGEIASHSGSQLAVAEVAAWHARILLRSGDLGGASSWAECARPRGGNDRGFLRELETLGVARVLIARDQAAEAVGLLDELLGPAEEDGRAGTLIEILVLRALARRAQGRIDQALIDLQRALALGQPERYAGAFLEEGPELVGLLRRGASEHRWGRGLGEFAGKLLAALESSVQRLPSTPAAHPAFSPRGPRPQPLVEALSQRELEVLRLMAEGLTNEQIAARLIIALGTVKAHIHNISGKLGAQNRAHAVALAKELGLL